VKIRGGVGEISIPIVEALPTTKPPKYVVVAIQCAAAEHGELIKSRGGGLRKKIKFMGKA